MAAKRQKEYRELLKKHNVEENLMDARCTDELFVELMEEEMKVDDVAPRLGLSETDITNALRGKKTEGTRRLAILREWKRQNGTDAICKTLVITLLKVKDQVTAEAVIVFAKENYFAPAVSLPPSSSLQPSLQPSHPLQEQPQPSSLHAPVEESDEGRHRLMVIEQQQQIHQQTQQQHVATPVEGNRVDMSVEEVSSDGPQNGRQNDNVKFDGIFGNKPLVQKYDISNRQNHGIALIIHNNEWKDGPPREGSAVDVRRFEEIAKKFKYDCTTETNLEAEKMKAAVSKAADRVEDGHDSFICFITSHGNNDGILGVDDRVVKAAELVDIVKPGSCKKLVGKPKIFIIQACRGNEAPNQVNIVFDNDPNQPRPPPSNNIAIPPTADFLFAFCTTPRTVAMRSDTQGSFYVKILYEMLKEHSSKLSLYEILLLVHEELATNDQYAYKKDDLIYRQMGQVVSTLRKKVCFKT